jgi:hypothetical protein
VKFTIEIHRADNDGAQTVLHRTSISVLNPLGARKEASHLLSASKKRGAKSARVLNEQDECPSSNALRQMAV